MEVAMINTVNSFTATFTATAASSTQPTGTGDSTESSKSAQSQVADGQSVSSESQLRSQLNVQILQSSLEVSIQAGGKSQELVFRAAIDRINEQLAPSMGPDAIQGAMNQDNSPEATAGRILSLSTGFYDAYAARRSGDDPTQVAKDFVDLVRGGFEKGFNEARDILKGLDVFKGDIASGVMKTFDLVQKGFDDFLAGKLAPAQKQDAAATASGT
jgi:hypothetical protein